uniref:Uncharacterized protein n=1 Tax=Globodera rostochiensis TaxID=31243 RepID=A0A914GXJ7_GLORO
MRGVQVGMGKAKAKQRKLELKSELDGRKSHNWRRRKAPKLKRGKNDVDVDDDEFGGLAERLGGGKRFTDPRSDNYLPCSKRGPRSELI